jgi:hypothetical protein
MLNKTLATMFTVSLVLAPLAVAYSADSTTPVDQNGQQKMSQPADQQNLTEWTKEEAMKLGVTAAQFDAADKNHDGRLDLKEIEGAGLAPRLETSK